MAVINFKINITFSLSCWFETNKRMNKAILNSVLITDQVRTNSICSERVQKQGVRTATAWLIVLLIDN